MFNAAKMIGQQVMRYATSDTIIPNSDSDSPDVALRLLCAWCLA